MIVPKALVIIVSYKKVTCKRVLCLQNKYYDLRACNKRNQKMNGAMPCPLRLEYIHPFKFNTVEISTNNKYVYKNTTFTEP